MTRYQFSITIPATGEPAINLAAAALTGTVNVAYPRGWNQTYGSSTLFFTRLEAYMDVGSTGDGYIGPSSVTAAGANKAYVLAPSPAALQTGGYTLIQSYEHRNVGDLSQYWVHGTNAGDVMWIVYHQA